MSKPINYIGLQTYLKHCIGVLPDRYKSQESNRLTLVYFTVSAFDLLDKLELLQSQRDDIIDMVYSLQVLPDESGSNLARCGFRGSSLIGNPWNPQCQPTQVLQHDYAHIANTYVALCILKIFGDDYSRVNRDAITAGLRALQNADGSFSALASGSESDLRFVFCAAAISSLLNDWSGVDIDRATNYILSCQSEWDNGFGQCPGQEGHGGSTYCGLAALYLMGRLDQVPRRAELVQWLLERQHSGFQGRVGKDADTCYGWWIGASLMMLDAWHFVDHEQLKAFVFSCQHGGGFGKKADVGADPLHTYFSLCSLGMSGEPGFQEIDAAVGMTKRSRANRSIFDS